MIAPPKPPCNAEGTQSEGRARDLGQMGATNNKSIIGAGTPRRIPRPEHLLCAAAARNPLVGLYFLARLLAEVGVAQVDVAAHAGVGVILILVYSFASERIAGWRYSVCGHEAYPFVVRASGAPTRRGHFFI